MPCIFTFPASSKTAALSGGKAPGCQKDIATKPRVKKTTRGDRNAGRFFKSRYKIRIPEAARISQIIVMAGFERGISLPGITPAVYAKSRTGTGRL